jgi:phosphatidylethanolamine N-methyltransferase
MFVLLLRKAQLIVFQQVGANKSRSVTMVSSMGMWVPVHDEEWDGDVPLCLDRPVTPTRDSESGVVTFKGDTLPWLAGHYEVSLFRGSIWLLSE